MIYYWVPLIVSFILCFIIPPRKSRTISVLLIIYMFLIVGLRDSSVGTDTFRYADIGIGMGQLHNPLEYSSKFLADLFSSIFHTYTPFLLLYAAFVYVPLLYGLKKEVPNNMGVGVTVFVTSMFLYFIDSFNAIRQLAATFIFFLMVIFLNNKSNLSNFQRLLIVIGVSLFAFGIHNFYCFYLVFFFLCRFKLSFTKATFLLIAGNLFAFFFGWVMSSFDISGVIQGLELLTGAHDYSKILDDGNYATGFNIIGLLVLLLPSSFICALSFKILGDNIYAKMMLYAILALCLMAPLTTIAVRMVQGAMVFEIILIPLAYIKASKVQRLMIKSYMLLICTYFGYNLVRTFSDPEQLGPYSFCF